MMGVGPGCSRVMCELLSGVLLAENISSASWGRRCCPVGSLGLPSIAWGDNTPTIPAAHAGIGDQGVGAWSPHETREIN
jgi:hypothetical protein